MKEKLLSYMQSQREEIIRDICSLIRIQSDRQEPADGMPFGPGPARALAAALNMASGMGFEVKNHENYIGTVDFSRLEPGLDILAHLDVVPGGDGWTVTGPYDPRLERGRLYGRGATDNKGPAVCALYAMKTVKKLGIPLRRNVRLILGTDEECGSEDIEYYYGKFPEAPATFSPDAEFPLINTEKGRLSAEISASFPAEGARVRVKSAEGGVKSNVVPGQAIALITGLNPDTVRKTARYATRETGIIFDAQAELGDVRITAEGESAHASTPEKGNNAVTALLRLLSELPLSECASADKIRALHRLFPHGDWLGRAAGVAQRDGISGKLTISLNTLSITETGLSAVFDSRCPACADDGNMRLVLAGRCSESGLALEDVPMTPHHHVPADTPFIRTLLDCYTMYTGMPGYCVAIGGGTYVHDLKNGVAFGCAFPGVDYGLHGADEYAVVDELITSACVFAQAIIELCG